MSNFAASLIGANDAGVSATVVLLVAFTFLIVDTGDTAAVVGRWEVEGEEEPPLVLTDVAELPFGSALAAFEADVGLGSTNDLPQFRPQMVIVDVDQIFQGKEPRRSHQMKSMMKRI